MTKYIFLKITKGAYYIFESKSRENKSNVRYEPSCELIRSHIIVNRTRFIVKYKRKNKRRFFLLEYCLSIFGTFHQEVP